jgi:hypothetical protein
VSLACSCTCHTCADTRNHRDNVAERLAIEDAEKLFKVDVPAVGKQILEAGTLALQLLACHQLRLSGSSQCFFDSALFEQHWQKQRIRTSSPAQASERVVGACSSCAIELLISAEGVTCARLAPARCFCSREGGGVGLGDLNAPSMPLSELNARPRPSVSAPAVPISRMGGLGPSRRGGTAYGDGALG